MIDKDADDNQQSIDFDRGQQGGGDSGSGYPGGEIPTLDQVVERDAGQPQPEARPDLERALDDLEALTGRLHAEVLSQMRALMEQALDRALAGIRDSLLAELDDELARRVPAAVDEAVRRGTGED
ncbi:MAG TPA: hypothetical protein VFA86_08035 [Gammaproteobacteria bacterium]|nr:hypothetical protein [Gammaproteobacteria bacterium]